MMSVYSTAHRLDDKWRSKDIKLQEDLDFQALLLSDLVQIGLNNSGFVKPSPIQLRAIPLGKAGLDLIVQAKSGTGKTCIFAVISLENLLIESQAIQTLILAPTREIASQICQVISSIGSSFPGLGCHYFIGGLPLSEDKVKLKKCHIAVGTPGRIKQLIENKYLKTDSIRLFVLDEADKLLDKDFQKSINWIYHKLPFNKQMLALSATYPEELAKLLAQYMRNPAFVRLNMHKPALIGVTQFYKLTEFHPLPHIAFNHKIDALLHILKCIPFSQCLVFINLQMRAQSLCDILKKHGWLAQFICGNQNQLQRLAVMNQLKSFQCRILVTTDLTARGIDCENVNMIINVDLPNELETYFHRIGRAGRYGSQGLAITLISEGEEREKFFQMKENAVLAVYDLPSNLTANIWKYNSNQDNQSKEIEENDNNIYICKDDDFNSETHSESSSKIDMLDDETEEVNGNICVKDNISEVNYNYNEIAEQDLTISKQCLDIKNQNINSNDVTSSDLNETLQDICLKDDLTIVSAKTSFLSNEMCDQTFAAEMRFEEGQKNVKDSIFSMTKLENVNYNKAITQRFTDDKFLESPSDSKLDISLFYKPVLKDEDISFENSLTKINNSDTIVVHKNSESTIPNANDYVLKVMLFLKDINSKYWEYVKEKESEVNEVKHENLINSISKEYQIKHEVEVKLPDNSVHIKNGKDIQYEDKCISAQEADISCSLNSSSSLESFVLFGKFTETSDSSDNLRYSYESKDSNTEYDSQHECAILLEELRRKQNMASCSKDATKPEKHDDSRKPESCFQYSAIDEENVEDDEHASSADYRNYPQQYYEEYKNSQSFNANPWKYFSECCDIHYCNSNYNTCACCHSYRSHSNGISYEDKLQSLATSFQSEWMRRYQFYIYQMLQWRRNQKFRRCCCE